MDGTNGVASLVRRWNTHSTIVDQTETFAFALSPVTSQIAILKLIDGLEPCCSHRRDGNDLFEFETTKDSMERGGGPR